MLKNQMSESKFIGVQKFREIVRGIIVLLICQVNKASGLIKGLYKMKN